MRRLYFIKTAFLFFLSFILTSSFAQKEIDFKINLEVGVCFEVQTSLLSQVSTSTGKDVQENKNENNMVFQFNVTKKSHGFYHLNFMYTDFYAKVVGSREFTVEPKTADMLNILDASTQISMMMNKPFSAELSQKGEIRNLKKNKAIEKEFKTKTKRLSPDLRKQVYFMVNSVTGNEPLVNLIESWTNYIPASAVSIGDQWNVRKDYASTQYTFVAETDTTYIIEGVGSNKKTITNEIQKGMLMIINREEEFTINISVDKQTFLPKIIIKEVVMFIQSEIKDYPALSRPPTQSHTTSTLTIKNCQ
jgi:hypothetical protein